VDERLERQVRNEALMRTVNDQLAAIDERAANWAGSEQQFEFQCECGRDDGCEERVLMTLGEYERVRSQRDRFAVVPGHENGELERVVARGDHYLIVDKRDAFEHLVE
jgi:hypothetical protein